MSTNNSTVLYSAIFSVFVITVLILYYNWNNERMICQICWNNRGNDVEIWNRIIGKFFGTIGSALEVVQLKPG